MTKKTLFTIILSFFMLSTAYSEEHLIKVISDYTNMRMIFEPKSIKIAKGDTITWVNQASESHNMVTYPDGYPNGAKGFTSPYLEKQGEKWSFTFDTPGTYEYHCVPHIMMGMHGRIIVERESTAEEYHVPTKEERDAYKKMMLDFFDEDEFKHMPSYVSDKLKKK